MNIANKPTTEAYLGGHLLREPNPGIESCAHSSSSSSQHVDTWEAGLHALNAKFDLLRVATELLAESQGRSVLKADNSNASHDSTYQVLSQCVMLRCIQNEMNMIYNQAYRFSALYFRSH